jgi:hypothetical protein
MPCLLADTWVLMAAVSSSRLILPSLLVSMAVISGDGATPSSPHPTNSSSSTSSAIKARFTSLRSSSPDPLVSRFEKILANFSWSSADKGRSSADRPSLPSDGIHSRTTMTFLRRRYVFSDHDVLRWFFDTRQ